MVTIPDFHCCGLGSIPGQGTEIPQAMTCGRKTNKQKNTVKNNNKAKITCIMKFLTYVEVKCMTKIAQRLYNMLL